jgi:hypothetical protein
MYARIIALSLFAGLGALTAFFCRGTSDRKAATSELGSWAEHNMAIPPRRTVVPMSAQRIPAFVMRGLAPDAGLDVIGSSDPASKVYDPVTLTRVTQMWPSEIMSKEPRDPAFADLREAALRERITARLRKRVAFDVKVDVSCRTSSCEATIDGANNVEEWNAALEALDSQRLAETSETGLKDDDMGQHRRMSIIMLFSADLRDHAVYEQKLKQYEAHDERLPSTP